MILSGRADKSPVHCNRVGFSRTIFSCCNADLEVLVDKLVPASSGGIGCECGGVLWKIGMEPNMKDDGEREV
jgi:hypothetical protein